MSHANLGAFSRVRNWGLTKFTPCLALAECEKLSSIAGLGERAAASGNRHAIS